MKRRLLVPLSCLLIGASQLLLAAEPAAVPLDDYIDRPDETYAYSKRSEGELGGTRYVELSLTSQTWHDIVWKHQLFIIRPERVREDGQALLMIGGGRWRPELEQPPAADAKLPGEAQLLANVAQLIESPVAVLTHVPFQPIFDGKVEDEIISYTFEQFIRSKQPDWPLLLPMVKSAVRAMDTIQAFAKDEWQLDVKNFTVTGASKRGWTTWLTAAADDRVNALVPMVIDVLNMSPQMKHQIETWGQYSEQIKDYTDRGLQEYMDTPLGMALNEIVDPYSYRERLKQPKLILLGTNDRYWPLDALNLYWDELVGEKHVTYVPNNGHGLRDLERVVGAVAAVHKQAAGRLTLPKMEWKLEESAGKLHLVLSADPAPKSVSTWTSAAPTRNFREAVWASQTVEAVDDHYLAELDRPTEGFSAMFAEAKFEADGLPYYLSTNVRILGPAPEKP